MDQTPAVPWDPGDMGDVLRAALDRLIPADDYPGASAAGVDRSLARQLAGDAWERAPLISAGLRALDEEARVCFGISFAGLDDGRQDAVLAAVEAGEVGTAWSVPPAAFFNTLLNLTNEGYYADTTESGPQAMISWRMIGYRPGPNPEREAV